MLGGASGVLLHPYAISTAISTATRIAAAAKLLLLECFTRRMIARRNSGINR
jgi:hypothetical protein